MRSNFAIALAAYATSQKITINVQKIDQNDFKNWCREKGLTFTPDDVICYFVEEIKLQDSIIEYERFFGLKPGGLIPVEKFKKWCFQHGMFYQEEVMQRWIAEKIRSLRMEQEAIKEVLNGR